MGLLGKQSGYNRWMEGSEGIHLNSEFGRLLGMKREEGIFRGWQKRPQW